jgi:Ni/Co efflux regulator RcnB
MIKTISAALLAVSMLAAPALAATGKNDEVRTIKATPVKASVLNANAKMGRHHTKHYRHYSHRHHKKMAVTKAAPKVGFKAPAHTAKRG